MLITNNKLLSLIVPVYNNERSIDKLLDRILAIYNQVDGNLEAIIVVDGSPDFSHRQLKVLLPDYEFPAELINLSRNYGPAAACKMGMTVAKGEYFAVMSSDLQEPQELIVNLFLALQSDEFDITVGVREGREDPFISKLYSNIFWKIYKKYVQPEMPDGGIDIFGCNKKVRDALLQMNESHSSMAGQLIWLGFRRKEIPYRRQARAIGKSGWTFFRKVRYMLDSIFSFTDLPITLISILGCSGLIVAMVFGLGVTISWLTGAIVVPGYTPLILIILFSMSLILIALGIIGNYVWRSFENTKQRPLVLPLQHDSFQRSDLK